MCMFWLNTNTKPVYDIPPSIHTHISRWPKPTIKIMAITKIWSKRDFHFPMWKLSMLQRAHNCTHHTKRIETIWHIKAWLQSSILCVCVCVCMCHFVLFIRGTPKGKNEKWIERFSKSISVLEKNNERPQTPTNQHSESKTNRRNRRKRGNVERLTRFIEFNWQQHDQTKNEHD